MPMRKMCGLRSSEGSYKVSGRVNVFLECNSLAYPKATTQHAKVDTHHGYLRILDTKIGLGELWRKPGEKFMGTSFRVSRQNNPNISEAKTKDSGGTGTKGRKQEEEKHDENAKLSEVK